jgi:hypothetical protein
MTGTGSSLHLEDSTGADLLNLNDTQLNIKTPTNFLAVPTIGLRVTPATDLEQAYFYGTNAADTADTWRFDTTGGFTDDISIATPILYQVSANQWATKMQLAAASTITFTFPAAYINVPVCTVSPEGVLGTTTMAYSISNTAITITTSVATSNTFDVICVGNPN